MHSVENKTRVTERYMAGVCRDFEKSGLIEKVPAGTYGLNYIDKVTKKTVATFTDLVNDGVVCYVDSEYFEGAIAEGSYTRQMNGTEYEMLCRKLEAWNRGDIKGKNDIFLPAWIQPLYDKAIETGDINMRGRTASIHIPWRASLNQSTISEQETQIEREIPRG